MILWVSTAGRKGCGARMSGRAAVLVRRSGGAGAGQASAAGDPADRQRRAGRAGWGVRQALRGERPPVDPAGAAAAGAAAAGVLHDPVGAQLMEQLDYNLLYRWFVGLGVDEAVWGRRCSPRTATGCWRRGCAQVPGSNAATTRRCAGCCRTSTSRSTARRSRPGHR